MSLPRFPYRNRTHAGQVLAESLAPWKNDRPLIVGIPRGGVIVAKAVAETLGADLDAVIVRKVGAPAQPELAIGAVAPNGQVILDHPLIDRIRITEPELTNLIAREQGRGEPTAGRLPRVPSRTRCP